MLSVLILTRNEELDLPGALASVAFSDDIHILDSFSTDLTVAIAESAGAHVTQRVFDSYAAHRNFGLSLAFKYPWLLILDADERTTPDLVAELQQTVLSAPADVGGYRVRRRDFLFGSWLRHAQLSPWYIRLVRPERCRYTRSVNEVLEVDGAVFDLAGSLDHFPFSKGLSHWIARHNAYSSLEAAIIYQRQGLTRPSLSKALRDPDFHTRRLHQKALFYLLPGRPLVKFGYMILVRRAFLDGTAGVTYALLQCIYEYFITLKVKELARAAKGNHMPRNGVDHSAG